METLPDKITATHIKSPIDKAIAYVGWPHLFGATNTHLSEVLLEQGLKPKHRLLDVGAGCLGIGWWAMNYLQSGNYHALEPNTWLIDATGVARSWFHLHTFSDFKISRIKYKFDYILAHSIFTHADRTMIKTILSEAKKSLKKRGQFLATFYDQRYGDSEHEGWMYPAGVSYTEEFIRGLAQEAGFEVETCRDARHPAKHTWLFGR